MGRFAQCALSFAFALHESGDLLLNGDGIFRAAKPEFAEPGEMLGNHVGSACRVFSDAVDRGGPGAKEIPGFEFKE